MEHVCSQCQHVTHGPESPRFCSNCGTAHQGVIDSDAATILPAVTTPVGEYDRNDGVTGYSIIRELGRGGMGVVYEAREEATGRHVALKVLAAGVDQSEEAAQRFLREGRIAASLSHPRSTFIYSAGEDNHRFYITMELMPGGTLKDLVDTELKLPVNEAVNYILDALDGLEAAHKLGVVHRDVKPSNCFLTADNRVKVGDFGISKSLMVNDAALTQTGAFMGTPQFAAPEQIKAGEIDGRTDIYAIGATLFYLLVGRPPFTGEAIQVIADIVSETAPEVSTLTEDVPEQLNDLIAKTLDKDPAKRPQTAGELRLALLPFSDRAVSIADVGRRMAAFFIDWMVSGIAGVWLATLAAILFSSGGSNPFSMEVRFEFTSLLLPVFLTVAYFSIAESIWGRGIGKKLMGLKVVTSRGLPPRYMYSLLRAVLLPGLVDLIWKSLPLIFAMMNDVDMEAPEEIIRGTLLASTLMAPTAGVLAMVGLMATARKHNGFRGIHELLTKTRVVRVHVADPHTQPIPLTVPVLLSDSETGSKPDRPVVSDEYEVVGRIGGFQDSEILHVTDKTLGRPVWLIKGVDADAVWSPARMAIPRATRQHWVRSTTHAGERWDAVEAVNGAPFVEIVQQADGMSWRLARQVLIDLADELAESVCDGTIPQQLSLSQVWVNSNGQMKLLDSPVASITDERMIKGDDSERAVELLKQTMAASFNLLPCGAQDFANDLAARPAEMSTLEWAQERLEDLGDRGSKLAWDDRLGMLAVSAGAEYVIYNACVLLVGVLLQFATPIGEIPLLIVMMLVAMAMPVIVGYRFWGGPVFQLTKVRVRRKGTAASRLRCAVRNAAAWWLPTVGHSWLSWWVLEISAGNQEMQMQTNVVATILVMFSLIFLCAFAAGAFFAVCQPAKAIQDYVAGTQLVPE